MKKRFSKNERGAAAVQFSIVATLLLLILFGIIEFGILVYDNHVLTNASREGARIGVVMRVPRVTDQVIQDRIRGYAENYMVTFGTSSTLDFGPWSGEDDWILPAQASRSGNLFGTEMQVRVKYDFDFLVLSIVGIGPITLEAETRMRME